MIKLDYDSTATYTGGVRGPGRDQPGRHRPAAHRHRPRAGAGLVRPTSPTRSARSSPPIDWAVPEATFSGSLRRVYGGVVAQVLANRVADVLAIPGVVAVQQNATNQPLTDSSADFINAPPLYPTLGGTANAGTGVIYGNLDTGIWPEHPSFADLGNLPRPGPGPRVQLRRQPADDRRPTSSSARTS